MYRREGNERGGRETGINLSLLLLNYNESRECIKHY